MANPNRPSDQHRQQGGDQTDREGDRNRQQNQPTEDGRRQQSGENAGRDNGKNIPQR